MKPIFHILTAFLLAIAPTFAQKDAFVVRNLEAVNSEYNEHHAIPFGKQLVVTTGRDKNGLICEDPALKGVRYTDLYMADSEGDTYKDLRVIEGEVRTKYHDGMPTYHPTKDIMVFTRNYAKDPELKVLQLFTAELKQGKWTNIKSVPFNSKEFSNIHPTFSPDGQKVYFSTNRPPGQDKDYNLWVVDYNDGTWGEPSILQGEINSKGTDYFPFMDEQGRLFFASNGHKGYGGDDIFLSENVDGVWSKPESLPKPINSRFDDFAYVSVEGGETGFLGSNRKGGQGDDDIYTWSSQMQEAEIQLIVINKETENQLGDAQITITPIVEKIPNIVFLDKKKLEEKGLVSKKKKPTDYGTVPNGFYKVVVNKPGFEPLELMVSADDLAAEEVFTLPLVPIKVTKPLDGVVLNVQTLEPIPNSKVTITNECDDSTEELMTDNMGKFKTTVDCACDYSVIASKAEFVKDQLFLNRKKFDCEGEDPISVTLKLAPPVKKGTVIVLENVYYDFDKANIRPDAAYELNKVVRLMERYPSMEIELGSHTDARGNDAYNLSLSQRRADSAIKYIISRGISSSRITARGYGETTLANQCSNGVDCTEEEHQVNRRTEITVTEFAEENVTIGAAN